MSVAYPPDMFCWADEGELRRVTKLLRSFEDYIQVIRGGVPFLNEQSKEIF